VKENQNDGGERQPGPACLLALPMQTLQKWAAKKAGREKYTPGLSAPVLAGEKTKAARPVLTGLAASD